MIVPKERIGLNYWRVFCYVRSFISRWNFLVSNGCYVDVRYFTIPQSVFPRNYFNSLYSFPLGLFLDGHPSSGLLYSRSFPYKVI